jgi:DNA adenine methylase
MLKADHEQLLELLLSCHGTVVLSGYAATLYDQRLADWERVEIPIANHSSQARKKTRRVEVLWIKSPERFALV